MAFPRDRESYEEGRRDAHSEPENYAAAIKLVLTPVVTVMFCVLYPLTVTITLAAVAASLWAVKTVAGQAGPFVGFNAFLVGFLAPLSVTLFVLFACMRGEHKLSEFRSYWWTRHGVRLVLLGAVAFTGHFRAHYGRWPLNVADVQQSASEMISIALALVVVGVGHFVLCGLRREEQHHHSKLMWLGFLGLVVILWVLTKNDVGNAPAVNQAAPAVPAPVERLDKQTDNPTPLKNKEKSKRDDPEPTAEDLKRLHEKRFLPDGR